MSEIEEVYKESKLYIEQNRESRFVSMIGSSRSESIQFLNSMLQNENLFLSGQSNNYSEDINWQIFSFREMGFEDFEVILMKSFDEISSNSQMSVFLLSCAFCLSNTVIIQVMQNEIQDNFFIENFSFFFLQSALMSLKHIKKLPKIILVIFASNNNGKKITAKKYASIVDNFYEKVNSSISSYVKLIDDEIGKNQNSNGFVNLNKIRDPIKNIRFPVSYFCVYNKENDEYIDFNRKNSSWEENCKISKGLWDKLKKRSYNEEQKMIKKMNFNHIEMFDMMNELTFKIQQLLHDRKKNISRSNIIENIYKEIIHSSLVKYRKNNEIVKIINFFKELAKSSKEFECFFLKKTKVKINEPIISELKEEHKRIVHSLLEKNMRDNDLFFSVYENFIYLSAVEFSNNFSLKPSLKNSLCYEFLRNAMFLEDDPETIEKGLINIEMNIHLYKCLAFYNLEFKELLKLLLTNMVDINKCISVIYKEIIEFTINYDYKYSDVLEQQIHHYSQKNYNIHILNLMSKLANYANLNEDYDCDIEVLLKFFRALHTSVLYEKDRKLVLCSNRHMKIHIDHKKERLKSKTLYRALTPTASGLTFGLINTLAPVNAIPGLSLSLLFIGAITTSALIVYPLLKKNDRKTIKYEYIAEPNYYIEDVIVIIQLENAVKVEEHGEKSDDNRKYNYTYTFLLKKNQCRSARLNLKFIVVCVLNNASASQIKTEKQIEFQKDYNINLNSPSKK
ncbi:hypothetical protein SteCoe_20644 [Stentor coeruleus]|uniref:Uncharacterized protein n=1 Tax=Stentor coeruleus TaxID=5963 RepID=A0A1R2BRN2_9CILI|nr:hypothetical protein SteCoe_20644 [Stentor coeruleus]